MKVEFYRGDDEEHLSVATAEWDGHDVTITCEDDALRAALARAFRRTPVQVANDSSYRRLGTSGDVVVPPGDLEWFRAAAGVRVPAEAGVAARFVPGIREGGFDPAANYRLFQDQLERLDRGTRR
jgi:hypothetical protein